MAAAMATAPDAGGFAPFRADGGSALHRGYSEGSNDPYSPAHQQRQRTEQYWKAHNAGILFEVKQPENSSDNGRPQDAARLPNAAAGPSGTAPGADDDPNLQGRKNSFLSGTGAAAAQDYVSSRLQRPRSPYEIKAGTVIPTVLITAINSDLPGPVVGQVRENVYDTVSGNYLLIPQRARLIANYDSMVAWGQERVLVCWNRLIFQDGSSINLQCMPAADLHGAAGLADEVNEHWGRLIQGVAVASLLAATTQSVAGSTQGFNPTLPQTWARSAAGEMNSAGQQITRRNINIQPTITVRPGFSVNVIVTKDLTLPPRSGGSTLNPMP
jgi:type IV secretion system protein VirB10